ncbi:alpha/beta fold hydrolase [uncultured Amphritea sp.]|uniref:alpha/beta fold hydrolase n=1 Tax=uncultured Amphritea sp. TaxID=981605 RepID=UPI002631CF81|nr:alpha/beta fold hydrolase [uncultured Amphritea sp.]
MDQGSRIAANPTGIKNPLLQLARQDKNNAVWLGRPCYFGLQNGRNCSPHQWTFGRYSDTVADSLKEIIDSLAGDKQVILVGHSGGGVLATIIAQRSSLVTGLITLAAPLDTDSWTSAHGYSPLYDSVNPAHLPNSQHSLKQLHITGDRDSEVTIQHQTDYLRQYPAARQVSLTGVNHQLKGLSTQDWLTLITRERQALGCY